LCHDYFDLKGKATYLYYPSDTSILKDTGILLYITNTQAMSPKPSDHSSESCTRSIAAVRDTLYVLSGKWKLPIIIALSSGPSRFKDLQRQLQDITPKVLSKELKELEMNEFVTRTVYATSPVSVEYELTKYSQSLQKIIDEMREWGLQHRRRLMASSRVAKGAREVPEL
jgi:DNA-binding HxlR family transcriptional regulator